MLNSLFGEFGPRRLPLDALDRQTVTATVEDSDVLVDEDISRSMRAHFASTRANLGQASSMITLLDPSGIWAPQVIRALSEAGGQGVERLNLRDRATLRTLAVIERTNVPSTSGGPLKVYHAGMRGNTVAPDDLPNALAESSQLTAVIIGALAPHAVTGLLRNLLSATRQPEWQCPWLVFILPPGASAMRQRILEQDWPADVRIAAMSESLTGAATVWNAVLTAWEAAVHAGNPSSANPQAAPHRDDAPPSAAALAPPQWLSNALSSVARTEGVLACGIVDMDCGELLAFEADQRLHLELRRFAPALCAARRAHLAVGGPTVPAPEEFLVTLGARQALLRRLSHSDALGFVALVDRSRANLALMRYRLMDAERQIA